jgi:hypothetical protein
MMEIDTVGFKEQNISWYAYITSCSTIFKLKPSTLKKYYNNTFKILQKSYEDDMKKYMN